MPEVRFNSVVQVSTITALAVLLLAGGNALAQRCSDIASVDFRNSTIATLARGAVEREFRFRNGVFDELEQPGEPVEWHFEIIRDTTVRPGLQTVVRFVQISGDHLRGSGSRNYLLGYICSGGAVKNVFQQSDDAMKVISISAESVQLRFSVWKDSDGHCCPSLEKDVWFSWDSSSGSYVETRSRQTERSPEKEKY